MFKNDCKFKLIGDLLFWFFFFEFLHPSAFLGSNVIYKYVAFIKT